jgi:hypothetical protein
MSRNAWVSSSKQSDLFADMVFRNGRVASAFPGIANHDRTAPATRFKGARARETLKHCDLDALKLVPAPSKVREAGRTCVAHTRRPNAVRRGAEDV